MDKADERVLGPISLKPEQYEALFVKILSEIVPCSDMIKESGIRLEYHAGRSEVGENGISFHAT